jgi:hypothetical protein
MLAFVWPPQFVTHKRSLEGLGGCKSKPSSVRRSCHPIEEKGGAACSFAASRSIFFCSRWQHGAAVRPLPERVEDSRRGLQGP